MGSIRKICVCSVQIPFVKGGAEYFTQNLVNQLRMRSYEVENVQLPLQTLPVEEVVKGCLAWRLLNLDRIYNDDIDLVIGTKFPSYMVPHKNKIIWLVHQYREIYDLHDTVYSGFQATSNHVQVRDQLIELDQLAFSEAKKIFTISKTVSKRLKHFNDFDSIPIYPPLDDAEKFKCASLDDFVLSVSRLEGNKRVRLLIEAMRYVSSRIKAVIIGEGYLRKEYEQLAALNEVSDRILFTGSISRSELIDYYSRAGALFYGPIGEDYGYATLEAFYSSKPVITCNDSGGILEFVDKSTGWVCEPDAQSIAANIEEAMTNKAQAKLRGEAGHHRIQFINWDTALDTLLK
ncbi:MAG TPA: glycosyltransferase family 4 protein [Acidobacteriota bacterium]|nr:glycosyltransferase family 4 protein [Acidobacteriota bacterium]